MVVVCRLLSAVEEGLRGGDEAVAQRLPQTGRANPRKKLRAPHCSGKRSRLRSTWMTATVLAATMAARSLRPLRMQVCLHATAQLPQCHTVPSYSRAGSKRPLPSTNRLPFGSSQASAAAATPSVRSFGASQTPAATQAALDTHSAFGNSTRLFGASQASKGAASQAAAQPLRKLPFVKQ